MGEYRNEDPQEARTHALPRRGFEHHFGRERTKNLHKGVGDLDSGGYEYVLLGSQ